MEFTRNLIFCIAFLSLIVLSFSQASPRRLVIEVMPPADLPPVAEGSKKFYTKFFESVDTVLDIVATTISHSLREIEIRYHVPYPYSAGIYVGFTILLLVVTSRLYSLFSRSKVLICEHVARLRWSTTKKRKTEHQTFCLYFFPPPLNQFQKLSQISKRVDALQERIKELASGRVRGSELGSSISTS